MEIFYPQLPSGVVLPFAGSSIPTGFLKCDGTAVSRSTYAGLFSVIGVTHGQGDGSTTFNIPDYRGRFLRGTAEGSANDPDRATRTAMAAGGNAGDNVGSVQGDATKRPNTSFTTGNESNPHYHQITVAVAAGGSAAYPAPGNGTAAGSSNNSSGVTSNHTHTVTGGGDNESRPINANVFYIIKF